MVRLSLAALGLIAAVFALRPDAARGTELLTNGGFEYGAGAWGYTDGSLDAVSSPVREGATAGRLTGMGYLQVHEVYQFLDVQGGGSYAFGGWVYLDDDGASRAFLKVRWYTASGGPIADEQSVPLTIQKPDYQAVTTGNLTAPAGAVRARFSVLVEPAAAFTVYLDDFSLNGPFPGSVVTPPPPPTSPPETATPAPTAAATRTPAPSRPPPTATPPPGLPPSQPPAEPPAYFSTLTNGGFEEVDAEGLPYGWRKFGGQMTSVTERAAEGRRSLWFESATTSTKWVYQTVSVEPGAFYEASVSALKNNPASESVFLRLSWYAGEAGEGAALDSVDSAESLSADAPAFHRISTGAVQAPPDARSVRVRLMLRPVSETRATAYFDDVRLLRVTAPPESPAREVAARVSGARRSGSAAVAPGAAGATPVALGAAATPVVPVNVRARPTPAPVRASAGGSGGDWVTYVSVVVAVAALGVAGLSHVRRRGEPAGD